MVQANTNSNDSNDKNNVDEAGMDPLECLVF